MTRDLDKEIGTVSHDEAAELALCLIDKCFGNAEKPGRRWQASIPVSASDTDVRLMAYIKQQRAKGAQPAPPLAGEAELKRRIGALLATNGCDCECDHDSESHDDDCTRCLACLIGLELGPAEPMPPASISAEHAEALEALSAAMPESAGQGLAYLAGKARGIIEGRAEPMVREGWPRCRVCGEELTPECAWVADGCPCNSPRGVNHGLVPRRTCTCQLCDVQQTGGTRTEEQDKPPPSAATKGSGS